MNFTESLNACLKMQMHNGDCLRKRHSSSLNHCFPTGVLNFRLYEELFLAWNRHRSTVAEQRETETSLGSTLPIPDSARQGLSAHRRPQPLPSHQRASILASLISHQPRGLRFSLGPGASSLSPFGCSSVSGRREAGTLPHAGHASH